eukprot:CAMPEP_0119548088 /NCGR_PEP_ID=MMETSP1352-20130426/2099_1 /TAXON_ID=265584 /ORGANISM="Stauroneis constricta, Strain CCMP1120" /LENGTH=250 /DNA_ID=CAMNT_0007593263 /DNA_START=204 /DNA_END=953 /DNA_ORIENTATION=-
MRAQDTLKKMGTVTPNGAHVAANINAVEHENADGESPASSASLAASTMVESAKRHEQHHRVIRQPSPSSSPSVSSSSLSSLANEVRDDVSVTNKSNNNHQIVMTTRSSSSNNNNNNIASVTERCTSPTIPADFPYNGNASSMTSEWNIISSSTSMMSSCDDENSNKAHSFEDSAKDTSHHHHHHHHHNEEQQAAQVMNELQAAKNILMKDFQENDIIYSNTKNSYATRLLSKIRRVHSSSNNKMRVYGGA